MCVCTLTSVCACAHSQMCARAHSQVCVRAHTHKCVRAHTHKCKHVFSFWRAASKTVVWLFSRQERKKERKKERQSDFTLKTIQTNNPKLTLSLTLTLFSQLQKVSQFYSELKYPKTVHINLPLVLLFLPCGSSGGLNANALISDPILVLGYEREPGKRSSSTPDLELQLVQASPPFLVLFEQSKRCRVKRCILKAHRKQ